MDTDASTPLQRLAWLAGDWRGDTGLEALEQHYTEVRGSTLLATSRLVRGERSVHREFLLFEQTDDALRLRIIHPGEGEVLYTWQGDADGCHVFETVAPPRQRIVFRALDGSRLHIRFEKDRDGTPVIFDFRLVR